MCDENKASVRGPDPKSQTKRRCGPLPRGAYKLFLAYFRTGSVPTTAEMIFGDLFESRLFSTYRKESRPVQEQHFRDLASLMRLSSGDSNVLECVATGRTMLPKEEFSDMVTMIHTHEGLAGPGHRGILSTISQVRNTYSIGEMNFGITESEVRRMVLNCPDLLCTHKIWKDRLRTGHWSKALLRYRPSFTRGKPTGKAKARTSSRSVVIDLTVSSDSEEVLDLSMKKQTISGPPAPNPATSQAPPSSPTLTDLHPVLEPATFTTSISSIPGLGDDCPEWDSPVVRPVHLTTNRAQHLVPDQSSSISSPSTNLSAGLPEDPLKGFFPWGSSTDTNSNTKPVAEIHRKHLLVIPKRTSQPGTLPQSLPASMIKTTTVYPPRVVRVSCTSVGKSQSEDSRQSESSSRIKSSALWYPPVGRWERPNLAKELSVASREGIERQVTIKGKAETVPDFRIPLQHVTRMSFQGPSAKAPYSSVIRHLTMTTDKEKTRFWYPHGPSSAAQVFQPTKVTKVSFATGSANQKNTDDKMTTGVCETECKAISERCTTGVLATTQVPVSSTWSERDVVMESDPPTEELPKESCTPSCANTLPIAGTAFRPSDDLTDSSPLKGSPDTKVHDTESKASPGADLATGKKGESDEYHLPTGDSPPVTEGKQAASSWFIDTKSEYVMLDDLKHIMCERRSPAPDTSPPPTPVQLISVPKTPSTTSITRTSPHLLQHLLDATQQLKETSEERVTDGCTTGVPTGVQVSGQVQRDFGDLLKLIFSMRPDVQQVHVDDKVAADKLKRKIQKCLSLIQICKEKCSQDDELSSRDHQLQKDEP